MNNAAPFITAAALNIDLTTLPNPYLRDGFGVVYVNTRVSKKAFRLWRRGILSTAQFLSLFQIKVGHTCNFRRRRRQYNRCGRRFIIIWISHFSTPRRMLLECLVHANIRLRGALPIRVICGCGVRHREYVDCAAAGGIAAVEQDIVWWKGLFGEPVNSRVLNGKQRSGLPSTPDITSNRPANLVPACVLGVLAHSDCVSAVGFTSSTREDRKPQNARNLYAPGTRIDSEVHHVVPNVLCSMERDSKFLFEGHRKGYLRTSNCSIDPVEVRSRVWDLLMSVKGRRFKLYMGEKGQACYDSFGR
ncbi:hypothetical protein C8F04DRAFT_1196420 [Mycena alexandri]|uniref:Bacteriophage T5 Orf172 DNA-binding domain-containing protein n=1 Tax=Mycena alexandri TaxID=1745969 RepID=A0AAD6S3R5_9AGAR|nr:hypothetical protein C8F04DRAFT_1196420 [Mycena alexandri]